MDIPASENKIKKRRTAAAGKILALSVLLLIALQIAAVILMAGETPVNTGALAAALRAYSERRFIPEAPVMSIWAFVARICGMHPLTVIYCITPVILIPLYYLIYMLTAYKLFESPAHRWFMLLCICLLNMWGSQSEYMIPYTLLTGWYTGRAFIVHGILPFAAYLLADRCRIEETEPPEEAGLEETDDYYKQEEEYMKNHKIINARNLAVALLLVVIMFIASVYIMNRKINSLYETTVNLQQEIEEIRRE
ncbi:MAG: hypothetical protein IJT37_04190 [Lachnospiraceae bacterium]|nr:hypothetical protein [Lachnospiraceae bacterium]